MKKNPIPAIALFAFLFLALASCQKDNQNKVPIADAGAPHLITLPVDTVTLTGAGTDADGTVTAYLWSQVSGPAESSIANPGSASSLVNFTTAGTYHFQLMVVDNLGATGLDTVSVVVNPPVIDSITFSANLKDGYYDLTYAGNPTDNYTDPASPELDAAAWTRGGLLDILRASLIFNLSKLPHNVTIQSAKLNLYSNPTPINGDLVHANYGSDNSIYIQRVVENWDMSSGWFNQPAVTTADQIVIPHTNQPQLDLIGIDVTQMVSAMVSGSNYGFMIRLVNETIPTSRLFCGVRYPDSSKHPSLTVTFKYN